MNDILLTELEIKLQGICVEAKIGDRTLRFTLSDLTEEMIDRCKKGAETTLANKCAISFLETLNGELQKCSDMLHDAVDNHHEVGEKLLESA